MTRHRDRAPSPEAIAAECGRNDVFRVAAAMRVDAGVDVDPSDIVVPELRLLVALIRGNRSASLEALRAGLESGGVGPDVARRICDDVDEFGLTSLGSGPEGRLAATRIADEARRRRCRERFEHLICGFQPDALEDRERMISFLRAENIADPETSRGTLLANVPKRAIRWLWPGRIAAGRLTMLAGDGGLGKSLISLDLAARVTTGAPWPDGTANEHGAAGVALVSCEDGLGDTVRPRFDAAGGDARLALSVEIRSLGHLAPLEAALQAFDRVGLVVVDPLSAYMGGVDTHKSSEVRSVLRPLAALADSIGVAVLLVAHVNKGSSTSAAHRVEGSSSFVNAARSALIVAKDPEDARRRLVLPIKNNLGIDDRGFAYRIATAPIEIEGERVDTPRVEWESDPVFVSADDVVSGRQRGGARESAESWLRETLADGACAAKAVFEAAEREGFAPSTVRRAAKAIGVTMRKTGFRDGWEWSLESGGVERAHEGFHEDAQPDRQDVQHPEVGHLRGEQGKSSGFRRSLHEGAQSPRDGHLRARREHLRLAGDADR